MSNIPNNPFEIKSPFRVPWYKDKSYLMLSALTVCTAGALWLMTNVRNDPDLIDRSWTGSGKKTFRSTESDLTFAKVKAEREAAERNEKMLRDQQLKKAEKAKNAGNSNY